MIDNLNKFNHIIFKNHPAIDIKRFGRLPKNIFATDKSIYELFEKAKIVIGTSSSGSNLEAVSCGLSVIIVASQDNYTANPLVEKGKGKIWDIAFKANEIHDIYKKLIDYRTHNQAEIRDIADWYKDNFFIEPTEQNIIKVFELDKSK